MAITREKKEEVVAKVRDVVTKAKTLVFTNFKGLTVSEANELRKSLRAEGVGYLVVKKSLLRRGLETAGFGVPPELEGEIALAYGSEDELAPARELGRFVKKFGEHLAFVGGVFGGRYVGKEEIASIAAIPGLDALRAQFVQLINSPIQRFAVVLSEQAKKQG